MVYEKFMDRVEERGNIHQVKELLHWDQEVEMPEKGVKARSEQLSTLASLNHRIVSSEELGEMIVELKSKDLGDDQEAVVREIGREHRRAKKVPRELMKDLARKESETLDQWKKAREEDEFEVVRDDLGELVELKRQYAEEIDPDAEPYRVLFDDYEPTFPFETMEEIMENLKEELVDLLERIRKEGSGVNQNALKGDFDREKQEELNDRLLDILGYDRERGNFSVSEHPFTLGNQFDARLTTRYNEEDLSESLMPTIHEFGHALYFLGLDQENYGNPLGESRDFAMHESQSRLWENHVGRTREFWRFFLPEVKEEFPQLEDLSVEQVYEFINRYDPKNRVRVHADEASYHLHIVMRFEMERKLINGELEVEKLPEVWERKMNKYLSVEPRSAKEEVLQDIHWFQGSFGYFPTYSLGSVMAAQIFEAASADIDSLEEKIERGEFEELAEWLQQEIHSHGKRFSSTELLERATGSRPSAGPMLDYLEEKYGEVYGI